MKRLGIGLMLLAFGLLALGDGAQTASAQEMALPGGKYKKVSSLVKLPDFLPGGENCYIKIIWDKNLKCAKLHIFHSAESHSQSYFILFYS